MKTFCLLHDIQETRTNDAHKLAQQYIDMKKGEQVALGEQMERLPSTIAQDISALGAEYNSRESLEARLAHDADLLECIIQAREYQRQGYPDVQDWIDNCQAGLKSESAKRLAESSLNVEPREWFEGLNKI